jgi:hypothetical protein
LVGDILGEVLGAVVDLGVDAVTGPIEIAIASVEHFGDAQAMLQAIGASASKLVESGSTAEDVKGFTKGVVSFASDLAELSVRLQAAIAQAALTGEDPGPLVKGHFEQAWGSLRENILENKHFWAVTGALAKGAAIAGSALSGGALLPVAAGLMVFLEADDRLGILNKALGEKTAGFVRVGIEVAAGLCLASGAGASTNGLVNALRDATLLAQGIGLAYAGYNTMTSSAELAEGIESQADLTQTLNQVHRLQRLLDQLMSTLENDSKDHRTTRELGAGLFRTQAATAQAQIISA